MIKITIELWPYGAKFARRTIAEGVIYNDGTGNYETGHYKGYLDTYGRDSNKYESRVTNFARAKDIWNLLREVLNNAKHTEEIEERVKNCFEGDGI